MKKKGQFQQPRKRQDDELEQAFRQVTEQANGKHKPADAAPDDPGDARISNHKSVVDPLKIGESP